ncbi:MAG: N-acetylglucosaminyldiphosphoundecaprenol N-acetyl-beta-D-mannosaminyltransferase [Chloroflexota bacterium]|nr:N-acetylglucosaminyldiphosphoundecaprenol N-acetyl-beta-D-mannosaminyltransferase [Chloroflexota bacterium]
MRRSVKILDVDVDAVTLAQAVGMIGEAIDSRRGHGGPTFQVATVNPEFVMRAHRDRAFREVLRQCSLRTPDAAGIMLAGRVLGQKLPERVPGVELVQALAQAAAARGDRVFLLGAAPGVAEDVAARLEQDVAGLTIAGTFAGDSSESGDAEALAIIREARPDIILVAYGAPAQENWARRNLAVSGATVAIGVGGTFDYLAGRVRRAPRLMRRAGLEWLYRVARQPWRLPRIAVLPIFLALVVRQRVRGG